MDPRPTEGPIKSFLSVCQFSLEWVVSFFFCFFLVFLLLIFHYETYILQNSGSCKMLLANQNVVFFKMGYLKKREWLFIFGILINIEVFYKLMLSFWVFVAWYAQSTQNKNLHIFAISKKKMWGVELMFCLQIDKKVFCKLIVPLWMCLARHVQSIQNNKFAMPLQYLKENIKDEVDFLPSDKHLSLLQTDTIIVVCGQACQNCPK